MTVVLVAASVEVKIELTESTAPAAIKMLTTGAHSNSSQ
jgi:hypothetical protein